MRKEDDKRDEYSSTAMDGSEVEIRREGKEEEITTRKERDGVGCCWLEEEMR